MKKFIAIFKAAYPEIEATQYSCITREQQDDAIDNNHFNDLIKNTTARHFFRAYAGTNVNIKADNINVSIGKIEPFK
jgi:hypothetical protein